MSLPIVIVAHSPCTLHLSVGRAQAELFHLAYGSEAVVARPPGPGEWSNPLSHGLHTIALAPGPYHLIAPGQIGWRLTGDHTIVAVPYDGEDPWPVPPLAGATPADHGLPLLEVVARTYFRPLRPAR